MGHECAFAIELPVHPTSLEVTMPCGSLLPVGGLLLLAEANDWDLSVTTDDGVVVTGGKRVAEWTQQNLNAAFCTQLDRALSEVQKDLRLAITLDESLIHSTNPMERSIVIERMRGVAQLLLGTANHLAAPLGREEKYDIGDFSAAARAAGRDCTSSANADFRDHNLGKKGGAA